MAALAGSLEDVGATLESRARDSPDLASLGSFAQYLADTGETERALETFERALRCCCSLGDPVEVANAVPFASRGSFSYYCSGYADALEGAGKPGEADAMYRTALAVKPDCPLSLGNYALFLQNARKDTDGAERFYQQAVAAHPAHASILTKYANFLKSVRGDHEQAERLFLRAIEASPENADSLGSYAVFVHSIQHDGQKAQAYYERAVQADPAHVNNLSNFGLFLSETKKDYVRAEALYKQCIELDPTRSFVLDSELPELHRDTHLVLQSAQPNVRAVIDASASEGDPYRVLTVGRRVASRGSRLDRFDRHVDRLRQRCPYSCTVVVLSVEPYRWALLYICINKCHLQSCS